MTAEDKSKLKPESETWSLSVNWLEHNPSVADKREEVRPGDGGQEMRDLSDHEGEGEQAEGGHLALLRHGGLHVTDSQPR